MLRNSRVLCKTQCHAGSLYRCHVSPGDELELEYALPKILHEERVLRYIQQAFAPHIPAGVTVDYPLSDEDRTKGELWGKLQLAVPAEKRNFLIGPKETIKNCATKSS